MSWLDRVWALGSAAVLAVATSGCTTDAFCFDCPEQGPVTMQDAGPSTGSGGGTMFDIGGDDAGSSDSGGQGDGAAACGADLMTDPANCGRCGNVCNIPGAVPTCVDGECVLDQCGEGLMDLDQDPSNGCECELSGDGVELCDGLDNDCDGEIDEDFDLQTDVENCGACNTACPELQHSSVTCTAGECTYTCEDGYENFGQAGIGCPYECPVFPTEAESCNGLDDDCDGVIDNGMPGAGVACEDNCPNGTCQGECEPGSTICSADGSIVCVGGTRPTGEICDGKDNDCDGETDEDFDLQSDPLNCGACGVQCKSGDDCVDGKCDFSCETGFKDLDGSPTNGCEYACPVFPTTDETCNGTDDDCDGVVDNNLTDVGGACNSDCPTPDPCVGAGNCSTAVSSETNGCYGVCSSGGVTACDGGVLVCKHADRTLDEACDGLDNNCDGRIDEGYDFDTDPDNCGGCGTICTAPDALAVSCNGGMCDKVEACALGFQDLDGNVSNGCEFACPVFPPVGESCNNVDDDCDGVVDNNVSGVGAPCASNCPTPDPCVAAGTCSVSVSGNINGCYGVCANDGRLACAAGGVEECNHVAQTAEICNGLDDDCDGLIDEDFDFKSDPNNCGGCGITCDTVPGANGFECNNGTCQATSCAAGYADVDGVPSNGCEYQCPVYPTQAETCNAKDDDCNGIIDDNPTDQGGSCTGDCPAPDPCVTAGTCSESTSSTDGSCYGVCVSDGAASCQGGALQCNHSNFNTNEICDGLDNDCDGRIDEGFDFQTDPLNCGGCGAKCTAPDAFAVECVGGACGDVTSCNPGYSDIDGSPGNGCEYQCPVFPPVGEACNNKDDDCDGQVDESVVGTGTSCTSDCPSPDPCVAAGSCSYPVSTATNGCYGVCASDGRTACNAGVSSCQHLAQSAEQCNGVDDDCNGMIDDGFDLQNDPNNCGACGVICSLPGAQTVNCVAGQCAVSSCQSGYADVDGNALNGCEYACPVMPTQAETCNGVDDDCDGVVDNNPTDVGAACDDNCPGGVCKGECTSGSTVCVNGGSVCQGGGGVTAEVCDGKDNDCDGTVDNGFNVDSDPNNCGGCGIVCDLPGVDVHGCSGGNCTIVQCDAGKADLANGATDGCEYTCEVYPPGIESCDGKDNDCDGLVDDADPDLSAPANFCLQTGECSGAQPTCQGSDGWRCNYSSTVDVDANGAVLVSETRCDGLDNNCNGQNDEAFATLGDACSVGDGICAGQGTFQCKSDQTGVVCADTSGNPVAADATKAIDEECNGLDDNCDGQIDERVPQGTPTCYNVAPHACDGWHDDMVQVDTSLWVYAYEASRPDADDSNAGVGDSRACSVPGVLPWTTVQQADAADACAAITDSNGDPMHLCTEADWEKACEAGNGGNRLWSYASSPGTYSSGTCNDNTAGIDGPWPTGTDGMGGANMCYADWGGTDFVYDLSGNVSEWTSTLVTEFGQDFYRVRGGNYQTYPNGTTCEFDFVLQKPTFQNFDLGFRCCADAAP